MGYNLSTMQELTKQLEQTPIIYVTRDIERAFGLENTKGYYIISNYTDSCNLVDNDNVLLIKEDKQLDTWELLRNEKVKNFINKIKNVNLVVFKPTKQIERICAENNWTLLNPSAELSDKIEEKISQLNWLGDLKKYLPEYSVKKCKNIEFTNEKFILQFNRSHTGSGTILIESAGQLEEIKSKFPEREARLAKYIEGPLFTNNNVVSREKILIGNINYQITGLKPFTDCPFATVGNDWGFPHQYLSEDQIEQYKKIVTDIGDKLRADGWKGLFGVDIVVEESTSKLYLVEINARQPASTTFESQLQQDSWNMEHGTQITTFEAHLASLLDIDLSDYELIEINDGAQIVQRVTKEIPSLPEPKISGKTDFKFIKYNNTKLGSDLLRLQTNNSIIERHAKLNDNGATLLTFITVVKRNKIWNAPRGSVLFIKNKQILLIKRYKYGLNYFEIPGGTTEDGEDVKETSIREGKEETNLNFELTHEDPIIIENFGRNEYYYFATNISGEAKLVGEELEINSKDNNYEPIWLDLNELPNIKLIPEGLTEKILNIDKDPLPS